MWRDVIIGLITGFISGGLSGYLVYLFTKRREKKYALLHFGERFLFGMLEKCEMYIPEDELSNIFPIGDENSDWHKAIHNLLHLADPYEHEDIVLTEEQTEFAENIKIALRELYAWKTKNKLQ